MLISRNKLAHNHDPYLSEFQDSVVNIDNGNFNTVHFSFGKVGSNPGEVGLGSS